MKVSIYKRKGFFKFFRASIDLGYVGNEDLEELYNNITKIFKEWDKK